MIEWYNRNKNRIMSFICALLMSLGVMANGITVMAAEHTFNLGYGQPPANSNNGYLNVVLFNGSTYSAQTWFWNISCFDGYGYMDVRVDTSSDTISFYPTLPNPTDGNSNMGSYFLGAYWSYGNFTPIKSGVGSSVPTSHTYTAPSDIVAVIPYGNYRLSGAPSTSNIYNFLYSDETFFYELLEEIYTQLSISNDFYEVYFPKLNQILLNVTQIEDINQSLLDLQNEMMPQFLEYFEKIYYDHGEVLGNIYNRTYAIWRALVEQNSTDSDLVDDLKENSNAQSNDLNNLNQTMEEEQNRTDIDSASSEVDANLDLEAVGSYGALLSSFTNNQYVVQILLATLSVALISYVFFGKR